MSAVHTALDGGGEPALLSVSFGPVQGFIAQGRSTSDLWAGSHLLASLVSAGLRPLVEELGPDCVIFPSLRGVPMVDSWLLDEAQLGDSARELLAAVNEDLVTRDDDRNPFFSASLPNKFLAVVPAARAEELARSVGTSARARALDIAVDSATRIFKKAGAAELPQVARAQIEAQMAGFPEVHWSAATWPVGRGGAALDTVAAPLREALAQVHPNLSMAGIFESTQWSLLNREIDLDGLTFWKPNAGLLYPAVHELTERGLAAAKATRPFDPLVQEGHRCTLCGEREWLTDAREKLDEPRGRRKPAGAAEGPGDVETVWATLATKQPSWAKPGEHLCAVCASKRIWPTLVSEDVARLAGQDSGKARRFVVSTHAMAIATTVDRFLRSEEATLEQQCALRTLHDALKEQDLEDSVLPGRLLRDIRRSAHRENGLELVARRLPALLELVRNPDAHDERIGNTGLTVGAIHERMRVAFGARTETYYALIQMDGDRMGSWISASDDEHRLRYQDTWHPTIRGQMERYVAEDPRRRKALCQYLETHRPSSPGRHAAISRALGDFSTHLARHVVEDCVKGRLLYAGGDDVLAMVAVDDLFDAMLLLRLAYSGIAVPENDRLESYVGRIDKSGRRHGRARMLLGRGHAALDDRLMTMMGPTATASMGAVVAHHQAPLARVLRELRTAEARAKTAGRDRFCVRVLKRGGGEVGFTSRWWPEPGEDERRNPPVERGAMPVLRDLQRNLSSMQVSRSALYRAGMWLAALPDRAADADDPAWKARAAGSIAAQFKRGGMAREGEASALSVRVVDLVCELVRAQTAGAPQRPRTELENLLAVAEFFARQTRDAGTRDEERAA